MRIKRRVAREVALRRMRICRGVFGVFWRVRVDWLWLVLLLGLQRRRGWLVIPAQMDITQARESGAARGGGGGGGDQLLVLLLLHPPVLKPYLDLPFVQVEQAGHLHPPRSAQVAAEVKLLLQLHQLRARVRGARPLGSRGRAWTLLDRAFCWEKQLQKSKVEQALMGEI